MDNEETIIPAAQSDWLIPLLSVGLVILLGVIYFAKRGKQE